MKEKNRLLKTQVVKLNYLPLFPRSLLLNDMFPWVQSSKRNETSNFGFKFCELKKKKEEEEEEEEEEEVLLYIYANFIMVKLIKPLVKH